MALAAGSRLGPYEILGQISVELATGRRELWKEFMPGDPTGITRLSAASISADGNTILFNCTRRFADLYVAEGLR